VRPNRRAPTCKRQCEHPRAQRIENWVGLGRYVEAGRRRGERVNAAELQCYGPEVRTRLSQAVLQQGRVRRLIVIDDRYVRRCVSRHARVETEAQIRQGGRKREQQTGLDAQAAAPWMIFTRMIASTVALDQVFDNGRRVVPLTARFRKFAFPPRRPAWHPGSSGTFLASRPPARCLRFRCRHRSPGLRRSPPDTAGRRFHRISRS